VAYIENLQEFAWGGGPLKRVGTLAQLASRDGASSSSSSSFVEVVEVLSFLKAVEYFYI
jgi:hypothetical protein